MFLDVAVPGLYVFVGVGGTEHPLVVLGLDTEAVLVRRFNGHDVFEDDRPLHHILMVSVRVEDVTVSHPIGHI